MKKWILLTAFIGSAAWPSPFGFSKGSFSTKINTSSLSSSKNYNDSGQLTYISSQNSITELRFDANAAYDLSNTWGLHADLVFKQFTAHTATYEYTTSGLSDLTLGSDFLVSSYESFKIISDFFVTTPFTAPPGSDNTAFYNDGAFYIGGKLYFNYSFGKFKNYALAGVTWRSQGLSTQIPLGIVSHFFISPSVYLGGALEGEMSLANDQNLASQRFLPNLIYNAGSQLYNSTNPQFLAAEASLGGLIFSHFTLGGGVKYVFWGQRIADETRFFVSLGYQSKIRSNKKFKADDDNFQVDTED